jgi:hypothetical protein
VQLRVLRGGFNRTFQPSLLFLQFGNQFGDALEIKVIGQLNALSAECFKYAGL